jgi:hypothetical protein
MCFVCVQQILIYHSKYIVSVPGSETLVVQSKLAATFFFRKSFFAVGSLPIKGGRQEGGLNFFFLKDFCFQLPARS